jgi:hypothetical protein
VGGGKDIYLLENNRLVQIKAIYNIKGKGTNMSNRDL